MISAIAKSTKEVVTATDASGKEEFFCPDCQQMVYPRHRFKYKDHFVHRPHSVCKTKIVASVERKEPKTPQETEEFIEVIKEKEAEPRTVAIELLFKYLGLSKSKAIVKEAIAAALEQNPSDATMLCSMWEEIQPSLKANAKTVVTEHIKSSVLPLFETNDKH